MKLNNKGYLVIEIIVSFAIIMIIAYFLINLTTKFIEANNEEYLATTLLTDKTLMTKEVMNDVISLNLLDVIVSADDDENNNTRCAYLLFYNTTYLTISDYLTTEEEEVLASAIKYLKVKKIQIDKQNKEFSYGTVYENSDTIEYIEDLEKSCRYDSSTKKYDCDFTNNCNRAYINSETSYKKKFNDSLTLGTITITPSTSSSPSVEMKDSYVKIKISATTLYSKEDYGLNFFLPYRKDYLNFELAS